MVATRSSSLERRGRHWPTRRLLLLAMIVVAGLSVSAGSAFAGQASSGQLFFYPCTSCHPIRFIPGTDKSARPLPNNFRGHQIVLQGHDVLGKGDAACLVCHDDPTRNPGMLKAADGSLIDIKTGDIALVCYRCHSDKYWEWKAGTHGKHKPSCVAAGCHDPHSPQYIYAGPSMPFVGTGFQFQALPQRVAFKPLARPAPYPATVIPGWFVAVAVLGVVVAGGLVGMLASGRFKR